MRAHVSEAVPVLYLAAVLGDSGQPLLVFQEIAAGIVGLFSASHSALNTAASRQHEQQDMEKHCTP